MRLYSMHKREFAMVFVAFFACFGLSVLVGLAGPPITTESEVRASSLQPSGAAAAAAAAAATTTAAGAAGQGGQARLGSGPIVLRTPALTSYHQQLWLIAKVQTDNVDGETRPFTSTPLSGGSHSPAIYDSSLSLRNSPITSSWSGPC